MAAAGPKSVLGLRSGRAVSKILAEEGKEEGKEEKGQRAK